MDVTPKDPVMPMHFIRRNLGRIVVGVILIAMVYGAMTVVLPYQRERKIAEKIKAIEGKVVFQYRGPAWIPQTIRDRVQLFDRIYSLDLTEARQASHETLSEIIVEIGSLSRLEILDCGGLQVTDAELAQLGGLKSLRNLYLTYVAMTDDEHERFKGLLDLNSLDLKDSERSLPESDNAPKLTFEFVLAPITDAGLGHLKGLTNLETLWFDRTQVTDPGLEHLKGMTNLRMLSLYLTHTSPEGRAILRKALPNCETRPKQ